MIRLSIIISTHNHPDALAACLEALARQTSTPSDYRVIVVKEDASEREFAAWSDQKMPFKLRVVKEAELVGATCCSRCAEKVTGDYCLFIDDDMIPESEWVEEHVRVQQDYGGVIGLGGIELSASKRISEFGRYVAKRRNEQVNRLWQGEPGILSQLNGNMSVPRMALLEAVGLHSGLRELHAFELASRLMRQGLPIVQVPRATVRMRYEKGLRDVTADLQREGSENVSLFERYPEALPHLQLGRFNDIGSRGILLRRILLAVRCPLMPLLLISLLLGTERWARQWYPFLFSFCYWHGVRQAVHDRDTWDRLTRGPLILMYHAVGDNSESPSRYVIPRALFASQIAWLKRRRYNVLNLADLIKYRRENRLPPARSVIITFDDGYRDNFAIAYPLLQRYGFPATIFLVSDLLAKANEWDREGELVGRPILSPVEIQEMCQGGLNIGAHSASHPRLTDLTAIEAEDEIVRSRAALEHEFGPVMGFAYPHGGYDRTIQEIVERTGFQAACCVEPGVNDAVVPLFALRRIEVRGTDSFLDFVLALWLGTNRVRSRLWHAQ
jgi:peptidoglycan/xylan/chitin deacetylase (PgdA/CDA1 family)